MPNLDGTGKNGNGGREIDRNKNTGTQLPSDVLEDANFSEGEGMIGNTECTDRDKLVNNR